MSPTEPLWVIALSPWIIQDGNYNDFAVGEVRRFALEFYSETGLQQTSEHVRRVVQKQRSVYDINAEVLHVSGHWWAIDFGLRVFEERVPPANVYTGDYVKGEVCLGIDPFFYFERLCKSPGAPELVYEWEVCEIERETAPLINDPVRKVNIPDSTRAVRTLVERTGAWTEGRGPNDWVEYELRCRRRGGPFAAARPGSEP